MPQILDNNTSENKKSFIGWLKKIGILGFLFFLIKGLVWTYVFVQAGKCAME